MENFTSTVIGLSWDLSKINLRFMSTIESVRALYGSFLHSRQMLMWPWLDMLELDFHIPPTHM